MKKKHGEDSLTCMTFNPIFVKNLTKWFHGKHINKRLEYIFKNQFHHCQFKHLSEFKLKSHM